MADPFSIIGTVASVGNIIELLGKSINTIRELQTKWQDADLISLSLASQMGVLRAALIKIQDWIEADPSEAHHQLIMDLDSSLLCCKTLVGKIDGQLSTLQQNSSDGSLATASKIKLILGSHDIEGLQKMIERQTNTLTLLLTACTCKTTSEQKKILLKASTRKAIQRVEKDSASLIVHRDSGSVRTSYTDNMSKLSAVFAFDMELFTSKIYERAFRASFKDFLRQRRERPAQPTDLQESRASLDPRLMPQAKIILLGAMPASKSTLIKQLRILYSDGFPPGEMEYCKSIIWSNINMTFTVLLEFMEDVGIALEDSSKPFAQNLNDPADDTNPLLHQILHSYKSLLGDKGLQLARKAGAYKQIMESYDSYWLRHLDRVFAPGYVPTVQDMLHARLRTTSTPESLFEDSGVMYRVSDAGGARSERKKWIHLFENVDVLLFTVPLSDYDMCLIEDEDTNRLQESLMLFESLVNGRWFSGSHIVLIFTKIDFLEEKLSENPTPLSDVFPEYTGESTDLESIKTFFEQKFINLSRRKEPLSIHYINATDTEQVRTMMEQVKDVIRSRLNLKEYNSSQETAAPVPRNQGRASVPV